MLESRDSMHYLKHLARLGYADIHPGGTSATRALIQGLGLCDGLRLLELGCGTGNTVRRLTRYADVHVVGLDRLSEMLTAARRRLRAPASDRYAFVRGDVSALPFAERSFDRVYAESVLGMQTEKDCRIILAEAFRVLRPGGLLVANEAIWKEHVDQATVDRINRQCEIDFGVRPASERAWSIGHWLDQLRGAGFEPLTWATLPGNSARSTRFAAWIRHARLLFSPKLRRDHKHYQRLFLPRQAEGLLTEGRLFVAAKPA